MKHLFFLLAITLFISGCNMLVKETGNESGKYVPASVYVPPRSEGDVTHIVPQDLKLKDDNHISFKLVNFYDESRECWATLEIRDKNSSLISEVSKYVGIIEAGENTIGEIEFRMPIGDVSLNIIPKCRSV